jgi:hypothetical protein
MVSTTKTSQYEHAMFLCKVIPSSHWQTDVGAHLQFFKPKHTPFFHNYIPNYFSFPLVILPHSYTQLPFYNDFHLDDECYLSGIYFHWTAILATLFGVTRVSHMICGAIALH